VVVPATVFVPGSQTVLVQLVPATPPAAQVPTTVSVPTVPMTAGGAGRELPGVQPAVVNEVPDTPPAEQAANKASAPVAVVLPGSLTVVMNWSPATGCVHDRVVVSEPVELVVPGRHKAVV
jgi:hypothetical protein